ncbi:gag-pol polyprotein [Cucumis melo var. makuwa]|uniref:Gag-pol polyprotein n=1 Tax=Cucumis melo var. makuwa TaxID=1194695 RepID=A0A5A7VM58_CUCMM|nr:gag-pol polyprotein [Cucumis melo var. makuwa]TYK27879.1 gag-pol polyprotein [Cucumis melo var. makuwa]
MNAFTTCITKINLNDDSKCSDNDEDEDLALEKLKMLRKEDLEARAIQKERIQDLMEENERLMEVISSLKVKLKENGSSKYGLGFDASMGSAKFTFEWMFKTMTGNQSFFIELEECASGHVTFEDGAKARIIAKGNIDKSNLPYLNDVRYMDGLKANLISISQLCDQGYSVNFNNTGCVVTDKNNQVFMSGRRQADNCYHWNSNSSNICHLTKVYRTWLWHKKLGHVSLRSLDKVIRNEAIVGIPSFDINGKLFCGDCQVGKKTKTSHRSLKECYTIRVLELLHLDFMGPMQTESLGGKNLCLNLQQEKGQKIIRIGSDHGKEFDNEDLNNFCQSEGIHHEFAASITPQQNGVVERKNRTLQDMAQNSRAYRVFNIKSGTVMETINVVEIPTDDSQLDGMNINSEKITDKVMADNPVLVSTAHVKKNHPPSSIIGDPSAGITTRKKEKVDYSKMIADLCYVSAIKPTSVEVALKDEYWINAMQEELLQFKRNNV